MALPANSIGSFQFVALIGEPETVKDQIELHSRPGVDGLQAQMLGTRGTPFTIRSHVDTADRQAAREQYLAYVDLIGSDPVDVIWWDVSLGSEATLFLVLDVRQVAAKDIAGSAGGLTNGGAGLLICDWDLVAMKVS